MSFKDSNEPKRVNVASSFFFNSLIQFINLRQTVEQNTPNNQIRIMSAWFESLLQAPEV